eukprot:CFRG4383T1
MVVSTEYYDLLGVDPEADEETVRRGYLKQARKWHPDKNGGDSTAEVRFKNIGLAYKVLSDSQLRRIYNESGEEGAEQANNAAHIDPIEQTTELCRSLFGFGKFDTVFGDPTTFSMFILAIKMISQAQDRGNALDASEEVKKQINTQERMEEEAKEQEIVDDLVFLLKKKLDFLSKGDEHVAAFHEMIRLEAEFLSNSPGGDELVGITGYIYQQEAKQHMGRYLGFEGLWSEIAEKGHLLSQRVDLLSQGFRLFLTSAKLQNVMDKKSDTGSDGNERVENGSEDKQSSSRNTHTISTKSNEHKSNANKERVNSQADGRGNKHKSGRGVDEERDIDRETEKKLFEAVLSQGLSAMWKLGKYLVEERLRRVCEQLLSDPEVSQSQIDIWADGLLEMGLAYSEVGYDKQAFHAQTGASDNAQERYGLPKFR